LKPFTAADIIALKNAGVSERMLIFHLVLNDNRRPQRQRRLGPEIENRHAIDRLWKYQTS
jgi:hypothetical protein